MSQHINIISIFDLDGTISKRDTYLPYLLGFLLRHPSRWPKALLLPIAWLFFHLKLRNNHWLKETFLYLILGGEKSETLYSWTNVFLDKLFINGLRQDIIEILENRRKKNDVIILATASLDIYVKKIADRLHIQHIICTKVRWQSDNLTGKLEEKNCYGPEKLRQVKLYLKKNNLSNYNQLHVYSDHCSDLPLMTHYDKAFAVYPTKKLKKLAKQYNIQIIEKNVQRKNK